MKIHWIGTASVSNLKRAENAVTNGALGLPFHQGSGRLAVVGGGPSIRTRIDELRNFSGAVWAVNGTINWCIDHDIDAVFYTIDAAPIENWVYDLSRIRRAVISIECDPGTVAALMARADVAFLPCEQAGPTSAAGAGALGLVAGYSEIAFYGCESSFTDTETHAFQSFPVRDWIIAEVGGQRFGTKPEFAEQAQTISQIIRLAPHVYRDKSGGLLGAMVEHGHDYDVCNLSPSLKASLQDKLA